MPDEVSENEQNAGQSRWRHADGKRMAPWLRETLEWIKALAIALAATLIIRTFVVDFVRVDGPSMEPTLYTGERLVINRFIYRFEQPHRGQIIICHFPDENGLFVKRVIATAGETVRVKDGVVYVNDQPLSEDYIMEPPFEDFEAYTVPTGTVFVMGDNRNDSMDSRKPYVGPIPLKGVLGPAMAIVWPFNRMEGLNQPTYK
jgi:signal peptidase I